MKKVSATFSQFGSTEQLALCFLVALLLRCLVLVYVGNDVRKFYTYDSSEYVALAQNMLHHGIFSQEDAPPFSPDLERTPSYPVFLAAVLAVFRNSFQAIILSQILIGSMTAVLTFYTAKKLEFSTLTGLVAAWIVATDPVAILLSNRLLTETLFTFGLILGALLLVLYMGNKQIEILILSAIIISLSALTRPIAQFLPIALFPLFIVAQKDTPLRNRITRGLLFVFVCSAIMSLWGYRNYKVGNIFMLSTISDTNLIYYRARAVLAEANNITQEEATKQLREEIETVAIQQNLSQSEIISLQRKRALQIFSHYPRQTVAMLAKGVGRMLVDPGFTIICTMLDNSSIKYECIPGQSSMLESGLLNKAITAFQEMDLIQQLTLLWGIFIIGIAYVGGIGGIVHLLRERNWVSIFFLGIIILYFIILSAGGETNYRFRAPILPFLAILSGVGYDAMSKYIFARKKHLLE
jgi:4-amino-4-deoxy-L-arabinose transferase-like glycosyltransferase